MINKNKIRVIGDVSNFYNGPDVLDLREIAKARKEKEEKIRERDIINLRMVGEVFEKTKKQKNKKTNGEELAMSKQETGNRKQETAFGDQGLKLSKVEVKKPAVEKFFRKSWFSRQAEKKRLRNFKLAEIKRLKLEKIAKAEELKKAQLLERQNLRLKKELEKREAKKNWLLAKQEKKKKRQEKKKALREKLFLQKQQLKIKKQEEEKSLREKQILEKQRLELIFSAKKEELRIKKIAENQEIELRKQLEKEECEQRRLIEKQRLRLEEQQKPKKTRIDYLLLFKNRFGKGFGFSLVFFFFAGLILFSGIKGLDYFNTKAFETKSKILGDAGVAYQYISSATGSASDKDFAMANYKFGVAADRFLNAKSDLNQYGEVLTSVLKILPGASAVRSGDNLLSAGASLSKAGEYLTSAVTPLNDLGSFIKVGDENNNKASLTEIISNSANDLKLAVEKLDQANNDLKKVNINDLPADVSSKISVVKDNLPKINQDLKVLVGYSDYILEILGHKGSKRYLVLFENNRELRPTGGFMGTYALVDIDSGRIKNIKIEGPYSLDGNLMEKIIAPEPLRLIQVKFFLRDSNWFLDFPMSAKKVMSMYEKSGGPTVDGVFTVTGNVMQALLSVIGEIDMPEYNTKVNADNFFDETQYKVEYDYDKQENEPKKFLADLFPAFLDRLANLDKTKRLEVFNVMYKMLDEKDIMMYFNDEKLENFAKNFNFTGEIKETSKDFLSVVITNIGGGKTDNVIDQKILHEAEIMEDGSIIDTVTITRIHNGNSNDFWTSIKNMSYMRVYVPLGSEMLEAKGFDVEFWGVLRSLEEGSNPDPLISDIESNMKVNNENGIRIMQEDGKTVFGNWMGVECGQVKTAVIKYRLPFKVKNFGQDLASSYGMFFQKQPGAKAFDTTSILKYPKDFYVNWKYSSDNLLSDVADGLQYSTKLNKDKAYAVVFVR